MAAHADLADVDDNVKALRIAMWSIFGSCIILRLAAIFFWTRSWGPDSVWAALDMFFSSVPFICYWIIFFEMKSALQVREATMHVPSAYHNSSVGMSEMCTQPFVAGECDGGVMIGGVNCCMWNDWSLVMAGGGKVPLFGYDETFSINNWYGWVTKWLSILCMSWIWKDMPLIPASGSDKKFLDDVWVDILDAAVFSDFVVSPWVQYYHFDLYHDGTHSGTQNGRQCVDGWLHSTEGQLSCSGPLQQAIFTVWLVAFFTSILAPALWTMFRFCDVDSTDDKDIEGLLADFTTHIRLLDRAEAKGMVDSLVDEQVKAYEEDDGKREDATHPVTVVREGAKDHTGSSLFQEGLVDDLTSAFSRHAKEQEERRAGVAQYDPKKPGSYLVTYNDDPNGKPVSVHITCLEPDVEDHQKMCGKKCCKGWCRPSYLQAEDRPTQQFERRGNYYDSIRSAFLLEIPFFIYRFHFIVLSGNSRMGAGTILLLKNAIFMCLDLLHVIACGNTKATCLNFTPIDKFEKFIRGSKLNSVFVGPGGMFKLAADLTTKGLLEKANEVKNRLNQHKAWLILEHEKSQADRDDPDKADQRKVFEKECVEFSKAIDDVQDKITKVDERMKACHM